MTYEEFLNALGEILDTQPTDEVVSVLERIRDGWPDTKKLESDLKEERERFKRRFLGKDEMSKVEVKKEIEKDKDEDREFIVKRDEIFE